MQFNPAVEIPITEDIILTATAASFNRALQISASLTVWNGELIHNADLKPASEIERRRFIKSLKSKIEIDAAAIEKALVAMAETLRERLTSSEQEKQTTQAQATEPEIEILDDAPIILRRPLALLDEAAYAATWVHVQKRVSQRVDSDGNIYTLAKPETISSRGLWIVNSTGEVFGEKGTCKLEDLDIQWSFKATPPVSDDRLWSAQGVKRFRDGDRPDAADVFRRVTGVIDRFIDFDHSLANQETMCELVGCYILSTWFLDAFNVMGYLWPNGEVGSGKTQLLNVIAELSYLGQLILSGGTYTTLRDLADCGATLCFDEAENIAKSTLPDDDKKALLLAGNRRGSTVTFKEPTPDGKAWQIRFVNTFSARCFGAINMPNGALESRTVVIPLIRSTDRRRIDDDVLDYKKWPADRRRLIDDLWAIGLCHVSELRAADDHIARHTRMSGRNLEPFRSILAVAHWLTGRGIEGIYTRLEQLSVDYQAERRAFDGGDLRVLIVRALFGLTGCDTCDTCDTSIGDIRGEDKIKTSDIRDAVISIAETEEIFSKTDWITPSKIGKTLQKMRFKKSRLAGSGQNAWLVRFTELTRWIKSLGIGGESLKQVSQVSQVSHLFGNSNDSNVSRCDTCKAQVSHPETDGTEVSHPEFEQVSHFENDDDEELYR